MRSSAAPYPYNDTTAPPHTQQRKTMLTDGCKNVFFVTGNKIVMDDCLG